MYFNTEGASANTYDAIVVGSGITGGWAAMELCEKGLKTLVLERGRDIKHGDYPTANLDPWELPNWDRLDHEEKKKYSYITRTAYVSNHSNIHHFTPDAEQPFTEVKPFNWIRAYQVGGKSLVWGRHTYRWSNLDFEANARDGHGIDWPIRYEDLAPWYDHVESFAGISGRAEGLAHLPDGKFLPEIPLTCVEEDFNAKLRGSYPGRIVTPIRAAHLTAPLPNSTRGTCQYRNRCLRGCPHGAYFSSNAATIPAAAATGKLTLRPHSVVHSIIYNEKTQKATGVRVIDTSSREMHEYTARIIFLNAGTLNTALIMLNSTSHRFPNGFGNDSGELGHNVMDHHFMVGADARVEGYEDNYFKGRKPVGYYVPRYRNLDTRSQHKDFVRGFAYQGDSGRQGWGRAIAEAGVGGVWKDQWSAPGQWTIGLLGFGECLPYHHNKVTLNHDLRDPYDMPTINVDCAWGENEMAMRLVMKDDAAEMFEAAGYTDVKPFDYGCNPGQGIHEMGTARMGHDPNTSVLNKWNQVHACKNVFVTDASCMTSSACQNPSLTYMAITARAVDYAVQELNRQNL